MNQKTKDVIRYVLSVLFIIFIIGFIILKFAHF